MHESTDGITKDLWEAWKEEEARDESDTPEELKPPNGETGHKDVDPLMKEIQRQQDLKESGIPEEKSINGAYLYSSNPLTATHRTRKGSLVAEVKTNKGQTVYVYTETSTNDNLYLLIGATLTNSSELIKL